MSPRNPNCIIFFNTNFDNHSMLQNKGTQKKNNLVPFKQIIRDGNAHKTDMIYRKTFLNYLFTNYSNAKG